METAPLFVDLGRPKPTIRQIADLVKASGTEALTEAIRRADAARYQEVRCRSALNRVKGMQLVDAGIHAGVLMNPIVPGITSKPALLERTVKAIADHGAEFVGCNVMFLEGGTRDHFMRWLQQEYPQLVDGYMQLYARKYAPAAYRKEVSSLIAAFKNKYGLTGQRFSEEEEKPEQTNGPGETLALPFGDRGVGDQKLLIPDP